MSSDLTFITNESAKSLRDRLGGLLGNETRLFDPEDQIDLLPNKRD